MWAFRVGFREVWLIDKRRKSGQWLRDCKIVERKEGQGLEEGKSG